MSKVNLSGCPLTHHSQLCWKDFEGPPEAGNHQAVPFIADC